MFEKFVCFLRIRLFTTLLILLSIHRVANFPQNTGYMYQSNNYQQGDNRYNVMKFEKTIASPSSIYFNSDSGRYDFSSKEITPTTNQRPMLHWSFNNRQKVTNGKRIPAIKDADDVNSRFIFPDQKNIPVQTASNHLVPVCKEKAFCENVANYPEDLLNNIIEKSGDVKIFSGSYIQPDIAQRLDFDGDYPLCNSNEKIIYPKAASAHNNKWYFILNFKNFTQGVRVETCSDEGSECNLIGSNFIDGYRIFCKQNYIYQKLAVVAHDGMSITEELFRFPTSCCCHSQFLGHVLDRMGFPSAKSNVTPVRRKTTATSQGNQGNVGQNIFYQKSQGNVRRKFFVKELFQFNGIENVKNN